MILCTSLEILQVFQHPSIRDSSLLASKEMQTNMTSTCKSDYLLQCRFGVRQQPWQMCTLIAHGRASLAQTFRLLSASIIIMTRRRHRSTNFRFALAASLIYCISHLFHNSRNFLELLVTFDDLQSRQSSRAIIKGNKLLTTFHMTNVSYQFPWLSPFIWPDMSPTSEKAKKLAFLSLIFNFNLQNVTEIFIKKI